MESHKIIDVKIVNGTIFEYLKWKGEMQIIITNQGIFIDNMPGKKFSYGDIKPGYDWKSCVGKTISGIKIFRCGMFRLLNKYSSATENDNNKIGTDINKVSIVKPIITKIAGVSYNNRQLVCQQLFQGATIQLSREPDNIHDNNAIAVYFKGQKFGYIPKLLASEIAALLDKGVQPLATIIEISGGRGGYQYGVRIKIQLEHEQTLPKRKGKYIYYDSEEKKHKVGLYIKDKKTKKSNNYSSTSYRRSGRIYSNEKIYQKPGSFHKDEHITPDDGSPFNGSAFCDDDWEP